MPIPDTDTEPTRWDRFTQRVLRHDPTWLFIVAPGLIVLLLVIALLGQGPRQADDLPERRLARDAAARDRARAFVEALGFEPGPVVCRSTNGGSAWCTARVADSDKTFSLWCSWRHPACIENLSRE